MRSSCVLIETPEVLAKAKRVRTRHQGRAHTVFVCKCSRGPSWFGGGAYVWRKGGGEGMPFTATLTHAILFWFPGERHVIKPKTTSV